jgi:hypothetical protein
LGPLETANFNHWTTHLEVEVELRLTVSRPVRLGVRHPSGTCHQFFLILDIFFRQLWACYFVAPSLTRGRVGNLLLLLVLASTIALGSETRGTQDFILLPQFLRLPQPGEPGPRIYIPQEQGDPDIPPGHWVHITTAIYPPDTRMSTRYATGK